MLLQGKHGLINVIVEPKLQYPGARTVCTVQFEKYEDVLDLGRRLSGDVRFNRYGWFPFTGYAALEELVYFYEGAEFRSMGMHVADISPDPECYYFVGWSEDEEDEQSIAESGWLEPEEREDFRWAFEKPLDVVVYYPVFTRPKELQETA